MSSNSATPTTSRGVEIRPSSDTTWTPPAYYRASGQSHPPHWKSSKPTGFKNPWPSMNESQTGLLAVLRARFTEWEEKPLPLKGQGLPVVRQAQWASETAPRTDQIVYTWLGHAACHLQIPLNSTGDKLNILTDPVFSYRCSPVQFMGPARYTDPPTSVSAMAEDDRAWPDVILLSHNHYDHLDYDTIKAFVSRPNGRPVPTFVVPLGLKKWFRDNFKSSITEDGIVELDWWDQTELHLQRAQGSISVTCTPAQHFSGRSGFDRDNTLWASYALHVLPSDSSNSSSSKSPLARIWFSGDSGYRSVPRGTSHEDEQKLPHCPAFEEIGSLLGPFDLAMVACGAYDPRSCFSPIHMSPPEAVAVHQQVRSNKSFGIHHATFRLTCEDVDEPAREFLEEATKAGLKSGEDCVIIDIGESRNVDVASSSSL